MKNIPVEKYVRILELFSVIHEELGEAQKEFNNFAWKEKGSYANILEELKQVDSPLTELKTLILQEIERRRK